jgi:hypothetical protein
MYSQATSSCAIFPTSRISIGCPACQNFVISGKKLSSGSGDFNPSERVDLRYLRLARFGYSQGSSSRVVVWIDLARWTCRGRLSSALNE